jgi:F-type H+-transporting ATPase subunit gamma
MENLKSIKNRINIVDSIIKATNAIKMVSTVKLAKINNINKKVIAEETQNLFNMFINLLSTTLFEMDIENDHWLLPNGETTLVIVLSTSQGFCGSFNQSIIEKTREIIKQNKESKIKIFGKKASVISPTNTINTKEQFDIHRLILLIYETIIQSLKNKEIAKIVIIYGYFKNALVQKAQSFELFPFVTKQEPEYLKIDCSGIQMLETLFETYIKRMLKTILIEHTIAELSARTIAMDNSVKNAREMHKNLSMLYNSVRQDKITQELIEIVSSMESLK